MGMTIDEEDRYMNACIKYIQKNMECVGYRDYIIEQLNKYQKIEEIVRWNNAPSPYYKPDGQLFREICEVLEDGKID